MSNVWEVCGMYDYVHLLPTVIPAKAGILQIETLFY